MLSRNLFASTLVLFVLAGCGGSVSSSSGGTTTASGGAGGSTTGAGGSTGGAGGSSATTAAGGTVTGGTGGSSSATAAGGTVTGGTGGTGTGGTGGGACQGTIDLIVDNNPVQKLTSTCSGFSSQLTSTALGNFFSGGAVGSPHGTRIVGCVTDQPKALGITLAAYDAQGPGTYKTGLPTFTDANGDSWGVEGDPIEVTFTKVEPTGGVIEGTFKTMVTHGGNAAHGLSGSFHVCHVEDLMAP